jgi:hypothetical protein
VSTVQRAAYTLTAPSRTYAGLLLSYATEAGIRCSWEVPGVTGRTWSHVTVPPTIVLTLFSATDRTRLLAIARSKIDRLRHVSPESADALQRHYDRIV